MAWRTNVEIKYENDISIQYIDHTYYELWVSYGGTWYHLPSFSNSGILTKSNIRIRQSKIRSTLHVPFFYQAHLFIFNLKPFLIPNLIHEIKSITRLARNIYKLQGTINYKWRSSLYITFICTTLTF